MKCPQLFGSGTGCGILSVSGPTHLLLEHQEQRLEEKRLQQRTYLLLEKLRSREVAGEMFDAIKTNNSFTSIATINAELIGQASSSRPSAMAA